MQDEMSRIRRELLQARASLAEHQTSLRELASAGTKPNASNTLASVPAEFLTRYRSVCGQLNYLERRQNDYLQQGYTFENKLVKENRSESVAAAKTKVDLESRYPALMEVDTSGEGAPPTANTEATGASRSPPCPCASRNCRPNLMRSRTKPPS